MEKKEENKALPFEVERGFIAMPTAVSDYYVRHPKFTPATERIYRYLLQRYNDEFGYAWPSWSAIINECNVSRGTVSSSLDSLEHLELIERIKFEKEGDWDNNGYRFNKPIEDEREFYRKFGDELAKKYRTEEVEKVTRKSEATPELDELSRWF